MEDSAPADSSLGESSLPANVVPDARIELLDDALRNEVEAPLLLPLDWANFREVERWVQNQRDHIRHLEGQVSQPGAREARPDIDFSICIYHDELKRILWAMQALLAERARKILADPQFYAHDIGVQAHMDAAEREFAADLWRAEEQLMGPLQKRVPACISEVLPGPCAAEGGAGETGVSVNDGGKKRLLVPPGLHRRGFVNLECLNEEGRVAADGLNLSLQSGDTVILPWELVQGTLCARAQRSWRLL